MCNYRFYAFLRGDPGVYGGRSASTDHRGEFFIDGWAELLRASESRRTLVLRGEGDVEAKADISRALGSGVNYLGGMLMVAPYETRHLRHLSDRDLLRKLDEVRQEWGQELDACLRECIRRKTPLVRDYLSAQASSPSSDQSLWRTAQCRAEGLPDPLVIGFAPGTSREVRCCVGKLPRLGFRLMNCDAKRRSIEITVYQPGRNLAVDCMSSTGSRGDFSLIGGPLEGGYGGRPVMVAAGEYLSIEVDLADYIDIRSPGTYRLRLAWREDVAGDLVDATRNEIGRGYILLYSEPFNLIVED